MRHPRSALGAASPFLSPLLALALAGCAAEPMPPAVPPPAPAPIPAADPNGVLPPGVFRLHIESPLPVPLIEHLGVVDTTYHVASVTTHVRLRELCVSPCDAVIDARARHELTLTAMDFPEPRPFHLPGPGGDLTLHVKPGDDGLLALGRATTALGAIAASLGTTGVILGNVPKPRPVTGFNTVSLGLFLGGAAGLGIGIPLLILKRTTLRFTTGTLARLAAGRVEF